VLLIKRKAA